MFDSLRFSQRLQSVGLSREQADTHAELARDMIIADTATKEDVADVKVELKADIADVRREITDVKAELKAAITDVRCEIADVKAELKSDIAELKAELKAESADIRSLMATKTDLMLLEQRMTIKLGTLMTAMIGILIAAQQFLR